MCLKHTLIFCFILVNNIKGNRTLCRLHIFLFPQKLHFLLLKAQSGKNPIIIKSLFLQISSGGFHHGRLCHLKSRKKSHTQCHNCQYRCKPSEALPDFPNC